MKYFLISMLLIFGLIACNQNSAVVDPVAIDDSENVVEVSYMSDAEISASADNLDDVSGAREAASTTSTTQYFQCKTDDGDLLTNTFQIVDYYYGDVAPSQAILNNWSSEPATSLHGAKKVTRTTPKGTQLVKSKSLKNGWHIVTPGDGYEPGEAFQVQSGVKGLIEFYWAGETHYMPNTALIRVNFKYVTRAGDRYDNYTADQQNGQTFLQWAGNKTIENIDMNAVTSTYQLQPVASTTPGTYKSIAYRVAPFKGYVFTSDAIGNPRGADVDLLTKKGVTLTYKKIKVTN